MKKNEAQAKRFEKENPTASQVYDINHRQIHFKLAVLDASKPLIIFVHGSPGSWKGWAEFLNDPELRQRANMISVDRPGFGGSGKGLVERSLAAQSRDLSPTLDAVKHNQKVILVGHSFGGPLVARMAMDSPEKISDLIILAGSIDPDLERTTWYQYPADWKIFSWMLPSELLVTNQEIMSLKSELTEMLPRWSSLIQNVSVIQGEEDDLVPAANADFAKKVFIKAKSLNIIRLEKMNHFLPWAKYELVKKEILQHL